jgi:hypothetical protein
MSELLLPGPGKTPDPHRLADIISAVQTLTYSGFGMYFVTLKPYSEFNIFSPLSI